MRLKMVSKAALMVVLLASLLLSANILAIQAQPGSTQAGGPLTDELELTECLKKAEKNSEDECLKQFAGKYLTQAINTALPAELGPAKPCLTAMARAGVQLGNRSVAEEYQGQPGQAVEFLWGVFGRCLKSLIPGLEVVEEVTKALIPKAPNSLIWFPIPDPLDGVPDMITVLRKLGGHRTALIHNTVAVEKTTLPFAHEWGAESPPGCLVPEIVWVQAKARLGPVPTHGDLQTDIGIAKQDNIVNIPLPRFIKFWYLPDGSRIGCIWFYNFMLTAYTVSYELFKVDEYVNEDRTLREERVTCRQTTSCRFIKKGTKETIDINPEGRQRESGDYKLTYIRLDGVEQAVGNGLTLTLTMDRPHELVYGWTRLTADLIIDKITIKPIPPQTGQVQKGQEFEVYVEVRNKGEISSLASDRRRSQISGETKVRVTAIGTEAPGEATIRSLQPGETTTIQVYGPAWGWIAPRDAQYLVLQATIDPDDVIDEGISGEQNNTASLSVSLAAPTLPDPAFRNPRDPKGEVGFEQISDTVLRLWADVTNLSPVAASNVEVEFGTDEAVGAMVIGKATISDLPGNNVRNNVRRAWVDWDVCKVPAGPHMVGVSIDPDNKIQELNERNNNTGLKVTVPASANKAKLVTDKPAYQPGEVVTIRFFNGCSQAISLRDSAPWVIKDSQGRVVFTPFSLPVITEVKQGETKTWTWDQKDNNGRQVPAGTYTVELETMDAGTYTASFEIKALAQAKLDVKAMGYIKQGPFTVGFEISVPVLVNGSPKSTPVSLQFDKGKVVSLTAQQKVTVIIFGIGQRTLFFRQWECQSQGKPKQVFMTLTIMLTLNEDTVCTAVYTEE